MIKIQQESGYDAVSIERACKHKTGITTNTTLPTTSTPTPTTKNLLDARRDVLDALSELLEVPVHVAHGREGIVRG